MHQTVREVMTPNPRALAPSATVMEAAHAMRESDIGNIIVVESGRLCGILTDRDIVVRGLALGSDPARTRIGDICSRELTTISPNDSVGEAVRLMRDKAIRRLPVEESGKVVGVITLGDVAMDSDPRSALADVSAAPPNA
jgi:CBS domain-containing protein